MAWEDLTYENLEILTANKMRRQQDNFDAFAKGREGSPKIELDALDMDSSFMDTSDVRMISDPDIIFSISGQTGTPDDVFFGDNGLKMYIVGGGLNEETVYQYTLSEAWNITTASYDTKSLTISDANNYALAVYFSSDGTSVFVGGVLNVYQYDLSTAWDLSTAGALVDTFNVSAQVGELRGLSFKSDGTKMYVASSTDDTVYQYGLSVAWDLTTASYDSVSLSLAGQETRLYAINFSEDGKKLYYCGDIQHTIFQRHLRTAWDLTDTFYTGQNFSLSAHSSGVAVMGLWSTAGKIFFVGSRDDEVVYFPAPWSTLLDDY